jgi:hypothetical protein
VLRRRRLEIARRERKHNAEDRTRPQKSFADVT